MKFNFVLPTNPRTHEPTNPRTHEPTIKEYLTINLVATANNSTYAKAYAVVKTMAHKVGGRSKN